MQSFISANNSVKFINTNLHYNAAIKVTHNYKVNAHLPHFFETSIELDSPVMRCFRVLKLINYVQISNYS